VHAQRDPQDGVLHPDRAVEAFETKGLFVDAIRAAVADGSCDLAVHSAKDLPGDPVDGLTIGAYPRREDRRDVLVTGDGHLLRSLPSLATVGTSSARRKLQLLRVRPDLQVAQGGRRRAVRGGGRRAGLRRLYADPSVGGIGPLGLPLKAVTLEPGSACRHPRSARWPSSAGPTTTRRVRPGDDRRSGDPSGGRGRARVPACPRRRCLTPIGALATVSGATVELAGMLADPVRRKGRALIGGYTRRRWSLADDVDRVEQVRRVAFTHWRPTHHVAATPRQIRAMSPVHDLHTSVHADVEGAGVGVAAGLIEGVLIRPRGLYLRLPLIADNVVFDAAVVEGPGDGRARWDLYDGGLERVALDRDVIDSDHRVGRCGIVDQAERQRDRDNSDEDDDDGTHRDEDAASARWCRGGWLFACCCGV